MTDPVFFHARNHLTVADIVELTGAERDEKYAEQARRYPGFAEYQRKTTRTIPVIALHEGRA